MRSHAPTAPLKCNPCTVTSVKVEMQVVNSVTKRNTDSDQIKPEDESSICTVERSVRSVHRSVRVHFNRVHQIPTVVVVADTDFHANDVLARRKLDDVIRVHFIPVRPTRSRLPAGEGERDRGRVVVVVTPDLQ